jgi:hypothetical protein
MAIVVYLLCMVASAFCASMLIREYRRTGTRMLLWSGLSFTAWAVNHAFVFTDFVVLPGIDLSLVRSLAALIAITLLLHGLIWDAA